MHSGRKRTFAASPHIRKYSDTIKIFLSLLIASILRETNKTQTSGLKNNSLRITGGTRPIPSKAFSQVFAPFDVVIQHLQKNLIDSFLINFLCMEKKGESKNYEKNLTNHVIQIRNYKQSETTLQ